MRALWRKFLQRAAALLDRLELKPGGGWIPLALVLAAAAFGVLGLADALSWWVALAAAAVALLAAFRRFDQVLGQVAGAIIVGALALVGFNVVGDRVVHLLGSRRPPILLGLAAAVLVFGAAAAWYLRRAEWSWRAALPASAGLAVFLILVVPILVERKEGGTRDVPRAQRVASQVDVMIVTDGSVHAAPPAVASDPALAGFDVRYSVGFAAGDGVRWTLDGSPSAADALRVASQGRTAPVVGAPATRQDADPVLVLVVDGTAPVVDMPQRLPDVPAKHGEVTRWRRVARASSPPGAPVFALLQTTRRARLARWRRFTARGDVVSIQALGSRTATDAALRLGIAAPTSQGDFALALEHRPVLLFDDAEPVPRPLSVDWLFSHDRVRLCHDRGVAQTQCDPVARPSELENGGTHLQLQLPQSRDLRRIARQEMAGSQPEPAPMPSTAPGAPPSGTLAPPVASSPAPPEVPATAIYVHPVSVEQGGRSLLYLDYWWYLPDNPAGVGGGAFCGAGLVIPGITCHDHQSDWEGLTVVVDRTGETPVVTAVQYAQHAAVVRYGWEQLRRRWDTDPALARFVGPVSDAFARPLAFIAKGTHATYPLPCRGGCHQVAAPDLGDGPHRGGLTWIGNDTANCGMTSCVQMLPTREGGQHPALWNAFTGTWGDRHCALTYYCDSGSPPTAPGRQGRYLHPTRCTGIVDARERFTATSCD